MIKVTVSNNMDRATFIAEGTMTVREAIAQSGLVFATGTIHLNGGTVADQDKQLGSFGVEDVYIHSVTNGKNA